jgi:hypothetical protein
LAVIVVECKTFESLNAKHKHELQQQALKSVLNAHSKINAASIASAASSSNDPHAVTSALDSIKLQQQSDSQPLTMHQFESQLKLQLLKRNCICNALKLQSLRDAKESENQAQIIRMYNCEIHRRQTKKTTSQHNHS